jgi:hypothetical protein
MTPSESLDARVRAALAAIVPLPVGEDEQLRVVWNKLDLCRQVIADLAASRERCAELEKDAARYRWQREHEFIFVSRPGARAEEFDAAVDAAIAASWRGE